MILYSSQLDLYMVEGSRHWFTVAGLFTLNEFTLKLDRGDLEYALLDMHRKGNDRAHFGIYGSFLYSDRAPTRAQEARAWN